MLPPNHEHVKKITGKFQSNERTSSDFSSMRQLIHILSVFCCANVQHPSNNFKYQVTIHKDKLNKGTGVWQAMPRPGSQHQGFHQPDLSQPPTGSSC